MNLMSTMVGLSVMGVAAPSIMTMAIAPHEAQLRAKNLGTAETAATVFAATYEGGIDTPPTVSPPCTSEPREGTNNAYSVTCTWGSGKYVQSVTRAFRTAVPDQEIGNNNGGDGRQFEFDKPTRYSGHQCPAEDPWGVYGYNDRMYTALNGACMPQDAWSPLTYQFSDPNSWLYDINNIKGYGEHPDY